MGNVFHAVPVSSSLYSLKKELLYIPLWGWAMKMLKPIAIDRSKPKEAITQTLAEGLIDFL